VDAASLRIRQALARADCGSKTPDPRIFEIQFAASGPTARLAFLESHDAAERDKYWGDMSSRASQSEGVLVPVRLVVPATIETHAVAYCVIKRPAWFSSQNPL
jgi:hypothetical protein